MNENIEKVLAALDGFRMSDEMTYSAYSVLHDEVSLLDDLLKAQEPVKPVLKKMRLGFHTDAVHIEPCCGGCEHKLEAWYKYCPVCGRTVKWDG